MLLIIPYFFKLKYVISTNYYIILIMLEWNLNHDRMEGDN
ncbi:hypothetical protein ES705_05601 [subsurface metagenome]